MNENQLLDRFERDLREAFGDHIRRPKSALLGWIDENGIIFLEVESEDADRPNRYYFTEIGEEGGWGIAVLSEGKLTKSQRRYGTPIKLKPDEAGGREWVIIGVDDVRAVDVGENLPETPSVTVESRDIQLGLIAPLDPPQMQAVVKAGLYRYGNRQLYIEDTLTVDWSAGSPALNIPTTTGKCVFVLVQIDFDDTTLSYRYGSEVNSALTIPAAFKLQQQLGIETVVVPPDQGMFRCGYIKLANGMTAITREHIWAAQEFFYQSNDLERTITASFEPVVDRNGEIVWTNA